MPIQAPQQPGFWLPGAEYFSLSPNTNIALQGRRRKHASLATPQTIPASTDSVAFTQTMQLETGFTQTSGIYIHKFWMTIQPSASGLVLVNMFAGLSLGASPFPAYALGQPVITAPTINIGTVLLTERDDFVCAKDIIEAGNPSPPPTSTLSLFTQMSVNNPGATPVPLNSDIYIIYTRLDGILE